jgi:hypothetical protein
MMTPEAKNTPAVCPDVDASGSEGDRNAQQEVPTDTIDDFVARATAVAAWLPSATHDALMTFAWRHFQRAESADWCIADGHRRDAATAQREASYAVSDAVDWTAQSRRPSFAELQRRRGVVA